MSTQKLVQFPARVLPTLRSLDKLWEKCVKEPARPEVWQDFFDCAQPTLLAIVKRVAAQSGVRPSDPLIEDAFQDTCLKIAQSSKKMSASVLESEGSAQAYLRAIAANAARDAMRNRFAQRRSSERTVSIDEKAFLLADACGCEGFDRPILFQQIDSVLDVSERDRAIFWLYFKQGFTAEEIACIACVGLSAKGVESLIGRMTAQVRKRLRGGKSAKAAAGEVV